MNFGDVCDKLLAFKRQNETSVFVLEMRTMEVRIQKSQQHLKHLLQTLAPASSVTLQHEFELFWHQKSHEVRVDMLEKTCQWIGIMKGATWCGIKGHEWQNQTKLFLSLCHDVKLNPLLVIDVIHQCDPIESDEKFVIQELRANDVRLGEDKLLVTALVLLKRFIKYFVMNSLITMYKALKQAKLIKPPLEMSTPPSSFNKHIYFDDEEIQQYQQQKQQLLQQHQQQQAQYQQQPQPLSQAQLLQQQFATAQVQDKGLLGSLNEDSYVYYDNHHLKYAKTFQPAPTSPLTPSTKHFAEMVLGAPVLPPVGVPTASNPQFFPPQPQYGATPQPQFSQPGAPPQYGTAPIMPGFHPNFINSNLGSSPPSRFSPIQRPPATTTARFTPGFTPANPIPEAVPNATMAQLQQSKKQATAPASATETNQTNQKQKKKKKKVKPQDDEDDDFAASILEEITQLKVQGNKHFRDDQYEDAIRSYGLALALLPPFSQKQKESSELTGIEAERALLHANRAATFLKLGAYKEVVAEATMSLLMEPRHVKSLYRRAYANEKLKNYVDAIKDYEIALRLSPESKDLQEAHRRVVLLYQSPSL